MSSSLDRPLLGIGYKLIAIGLFSTMDVFIKALSADYHTLQIVFARNLFAFLPLMFLFAQAGDLRFLRTERFGQHMLRSAFGFTAMLGFFLAFAYLPLATVTAIGFAGPIMLAALSVPLLGEKVGAHRWSAIVAGFIGVLIILRPGLVEWNLGMASAMAATIFYALAMIQIRKLAGLEPGLTIVFYFTLFCTLASGLAQPFVWEWPDNGIHWMMLIGMGILGGTAQIFLTKGYRHAPASLLAPFEYSALLWAAVYGWFLFSDWPDIFTWSGSAILITSGLYILWREVRRQRSTAFQAVPSSSSAE